MRKRENIQETNGPLRAAINKSRSSFSAIFKLLEIPGKVSRQIAFHSLHNGNYSSHNDDTIKKGSSEKCICVTKTTTTSTATKTKNSEKLKRHHHHHHHHQLAGVLYNVTHTHLQLCYCSSIPLATRKLTGDP